MELSFAGFFADTYVSFIMLLGLVAVVAMNRDANIPTIGTIWTILGLMLCIMVVNYISDWANADNSRTVANYWTTVLKYAINPTIVGLEVTILLNRRIYRLILMIPAAVNALIMLVIPPITGLVIVSYDEMNVFNPTGWRSVPYAITAVYLVLWFIATIMKFRDRKRTAVSTAILVVGIAFLTMFLEQRDIIVGLVDEIALLDIYIFYFFLTSVSRRRLYNQIIASESELSKAKVKLMQEQLSPHFVYNALAIIKSLVNEDPERASDTIDDFSTYLRQNINALKHNTDMIPFLSELEHIKALQHIEESGKGRTIDIVYDIREHEFRVPPLTIEPLFENALIHGIGARREDGRITIASSSDDSRYIVQVIDNGRGFDVSAKSTGVGIENVRLRLKYLCGGALDITSSSEGTCATVYIPKQKEEQTR